MSYLLLLTFFLAPAYTVRFNLFGFPTNLLMIWVFLLWLIFFLNLIIKNQLSVFLTAVKNTEKKVLLFSGLFFLSGIVSLFINGFGRAKLGQFLVLFLQPMSIFFIAGFIFKESPKIKNLLLATCYLLLATAGLYAILQYFTLTGLPPEFWGNSVEPKRSMSFFIHPNFYALWAAPLLAFLIPDLGNRVQNWKLEIGNWKFIVLWLLGAFGLLLSFSRAGWLGLAAAIIIYLIVAGDKKIRKIIFGAVIVIVIVIVFTPNLRWRFLLPFYGEKSAVSRLSLWSTGWKGVKESPVFGLGLTGFGRQWNLLNTDPGLTDAHNFPHNIFLDLWVETGLLGLISFIGLISIYIYLGLRSAKVQPLIVNRQLLSVSLFLIALLVQGLIDNPYFKNDLAIVFWLMIALVI